MNPYCSPDPCSTFLPATCVFYTGEQLLYLGVNTNDNVQVIIQKINDAFATSGIGYGFNNGVTQPTPSSPVQLGGALIQNTNIGGNFTLTFTGNLQAARHITTGGTSSQFVKGDGTLDSGPYQPGGNYITSLTGDGTASGPGAAALTLATVNTAPGTFGAGSIIPVVTVNAKGLVTNLTTTPLVVPPQPLTFVGDVVGSGVTGSPVTLLLQNVNSNVYSSVTALNIAVNAKGLVTAATPITAGDIATILGYTPGTVSSVGLTAPPAFNVSNSPITASGTINITAAGTSSQYIAGDGSLVSLPITTSGTAGTSGTSGTTGTSGTSGSSGTTGTSGTSGSTGTSGTSGTSGSSGTTGTSGTSGSTGTSGTTGTSGSSGTTGTSGSSGTSGTTGTSGSSGTSGTTGTSGSSGLSGDRFKTTSTTTYTLQAPGGTGTITVGLGLAYSVAQSIIIAYDANNHNEAEVTSYDPLTGSISFIVFRLTGSGTYSVWSVNIDGASGGDGSSGSSGTSGTSATAGTSGTTGTSGSSGTSGTTGTSGSSGTSGTSATNGTGGTSGTSGSSGSSGTTGTSGTSATSGTSGTTGTSGTSGSSGTTGTSGTSGTRGSNGTSGTSGVNGINGTNGTSGTSGTSGATQAFSNVLTMNSGGVGGASGTTYNGSTPITLSYNTIGAPSTTGANASGTWGINITGNAETVDGFSASQSNVANNIVVRDASGYIFGSYINMTDDGNPGAGTTITSFITKQSDNYYRSASPANASNSIRANASGTWSIAISGNAATATNLSNNWTNWSSVGGYNSVVGSLAWKNYGNNHVIFDASQSTSPNGVSVNNTNSCAAWTPTYPTLMGWNGSITYGVRVDCARSAEVAATASNAVIVPGGGTCSSVRCGVSNTASADCSFSGGGSGNNASGTWATVVGGVSNSATGDRSFIGGGSSNQACAFGSFVGGGDSNVAGSTYSTVVGGGSNGAYGTQSFIGGGGFVYAYGISAVAVGGCNINSGGYASFVGGGQNNTACSTYAIVVGGCSNGVYGVSSSIVGGSNNSINGGSNNFIGGGQYSCTGGCTSSSSILGSFNSITGSCNIHIVGGGIGCASVDNYTYVNNLCQIGGGISDCRVKNNICNTGFGLNEILQLRPVSYCFNGDDSKKFGFIAQEVQEVLPELVDLNPIEKVGEDGKRTVHGEGDPLLHFDKEAIFSSYVNAFKDLYKLNKDLEARVSALEEALKAK
jgi:hypothetical protein